MKISRPLSLTVVGALAAGVLPLVVAAPAQAAPVNPIPVTAADISTDGSSGWAVESRNTGNGAFVTGTGTPPMGTGSYRLKSNVTGDKQFLHMTRIDGVPLLGRPLADILALNYSSYSSNVSYSPYVNIPIHSALIDADSNGVADGTQGFAGAATGNSILVYEPVVAANSWGTNTTIGVSAQWRLTKPVISGGSIPAFTYKTYAQWLAILTDGIVNSTFGDIQFVIGDTSSASWGGREGWIDAVTVTTTTESATYDLENATHLGVCAVSTDIPTTTIALTEDCTTKTTVGVANGWTLDGAGYTLTAIDPSPSVDFTGSVLTNEPVAAGATMHVTDIHVVGSFDSGCSSLLNGVRFSGAGGSFTHSTVSDIKYGAGSGCQSGNSVDINNLGGATRLGVTVDDVAVTGFQKTGIRANGNVALRLTGSSVESSDLDLVTASNSLQLSRGARAYVSGNTFGGNDWDGNDLWSASGVLLYGAEDVTFTRNVVNGTDTDLGVYVSQDATYQAGRTTITCNLIERDAAIDTPYDLWSTGLGADAELLAKVDATGNTVRGFATPYDNVVNETGGPCASGPVADLDVDGATTAVTATWSASDADAFAPVTGYDVTLTPGGATQTVTGTSATFAGLSSATQYTATVTPLNAAGTGTPASASGRTGPGTASITQTTTTDSQVTVGWTVPGTEYSGFDLVIEDEDGPVDSTTVAGDARSWTFSDLAADTDYTITVTPRQGAGAGGDDSVDITTNEDTNPPPSAPGPVTALTLSGTPTSLTASWTAAPGATDYEATLLPGGTVVAVTGTSATFPIVPGKEYTVTVAAHNADGWGPSRSASLDTTLPAAPTGLSIYGSTTYGSLTWTPPTAPSPVTSYTLTATPSSGPTVTEVVPASGLTFPVRIADLTRNTTYTFRVVATNAFGTGPSVAKKLTGTVTNATISPTSLVARQKVTFKGKVTSADTGRAVAGQKLYLYGRVKGTTVYESLGAKATTAANGTFVFAYKPKASTRYVVTSRGADFMGAASKSTYVRVKAKASIVLSKSTVRLGKKVTFSGTVRPKLGALVELQRRQGSTWVTKKSVVASADGTYAVSWKPTSKVDYSWRVRVSGATFKTGASVTKVLRVT